MNTDNLARTTFVLDRETHERLNYISRRMGVSRSSLVREVLAEPVAMMEKWVRSVPKRGATPADAERVLGDIQLDLVDFINRRADETGVGL